MKDSCERDDNNDLINCQCQDAQRRIDNGQIDCDLDNRCPDDCDVCKFCLYYVVECHSHEPSVVPSIAPSDQPSIQLTSSPSASPTELPSFTLSTVPTLTASQHPSAIPSAVGSFVPSITASESPSLVLSTYPTTILSSSPSTKPSIKFDLAVCETYENVW